MGTFLETSDLQSLGTKKLVRLIDPLKILWMPKDDFKIDSSDEKVSDGDWDRGLTRFDATSIHRAIKDVFNFGIPWNETNFFAERLETTPIIDAADRATYKIKRCNYLNYLFNAMRQFGYVQDPNSDLVGLLIGRNGEVILNNGRHRVAMAQLLHIPFIPVTIDVRHLDWVRFCDDVYSYSTRHNGMVYAPIDHVDLQYLPSRQADRSDVIIDYMSPNIDTLADLGSNWGFLCHRLEPYGIHCIAVENDPEEFRFLQSFKTVYGDRYEVVQADLVDFLEHRHEFDCVLMMSILHHIPEHLRPRVLELIDAREMFFQFPSKNELKLDVAEWIKTILNCSKFRKVMQIGSKADREIFYFKR